MTKTTPRPWNEEPDMTADDPPTRRVLLASAYGWCAEVDRAVQTVETAVELHGGPSPLPDRLPAIQ
jgi:hypothetical protein